LQYNATLFANVVDHCADGSIGNKSVESVATGSRLVCRSLLRLSLRV